MRVYSKSSKSVSPAASFKNWTAVEVRVHNAVPRGMASYNFGTDT